MVLYIGNLNTIATKRDIVELFMPFGKLSSIYLSINPITKISRGFGYVQLKEHEIAEYAITRLHNSMFMDTNIVVREMQLQFSERNNMERSKENSRRTQ